ncbi:MAG: hypothetical protein MUP85_21805 [Candidatus Lokiarchaeota archaeon]|nr:hypothetical protein [Candidatus Lokiarchaeota archaeon]
MKKKIDWRIVGIGLVCLTAIEIVALLNGIDGTLLATIVGIIGLTIGTVIPNPIKN